jgi:hypothetical protein
MKITVSEYCPECEYENELEWDIEKDGWKINCQNCGEELMLCDECLHHEDNPNMSCSDICLRKKLA